MTIIDFYCEPGTPAEIVNLESLSSQTYIVANGEKHYLIGTKNIPMGNNYVSSEFIHFRAVTYSLVFTPIPFDTDSISFYEEFMGNTRKLRGIDLTGKSSTITYMDKKDNEIYATKINAFMDEQCEQLLEETAERLEGQAERPQYRQEQPSEEVYCRYCGTKFSSMSSMAQSNAVSYCSQNPYTNESGGTSYGKHEPY